MESCPHAPSETNETAVSVGERLRHCREAGGHTLEEVAEATKISKTYLRALEEDRFQDLPSPAYFKGFLRLYADYLGINPDDLMARVAECQGSAGETADEAQPEQGGRPWMGGAQRFALPLMLLAALVLSTLLFQTTGREAGQSARPDTPPPAPSPVPRQAVQPPVSSAVVPLPAVTGGEPSPAPAAEELPAPSLQPASGFVVRMKVLKNGTLTVTIDETVSQNYQVTAGDLIEWKAVENLALDISDTAAVELELNGKPLKHQAVPGKSAHLLLGPDGVRL